MRKYIPIILLMLLPFVATLRGTAQTAWDGTTATMPLPADPTLPAEQWGLAHNPYLITSGEELHYLALNVSTFTGRYLRQVCDIDLGNHAWTPIGNRVDGVFMGNYDGQGFTIKNLYIDWGLGDRTKVGDCFVFGLFGAYGAELKNLVLDGVTITRDDVTKNNYTLDLKIGTLAGVLCPKVDAGSGNVQVHNVIVRNTQINDGNQTKGARSFLIGGLVGDINSGAVQGTNVIPTSTKVSVSHVSVEADIDFATAQRQSVSDAQKTQFNVGGLLGRMRRGRAEMIPTEANFSGDIKAPLASVGPIFSMSRTGGAITAYDDFRSAYAGEFNFNTGELTNTGKYFSNFRIFNSDEGEYQSITDTDPSYSYTSNSTENHLTLRTLKEPVANAAWAYTNPSEMMRLQGVNCGTYQPTSADAWNLIAASAATHADYSAWNVSGTSALLAKDRTVRLRTTTFNQFTATPDGGQGTDTYTYQWEAYNFNLDQWTPLTVADPASPTLHLPVTYDYTAVRVTLCNAAGVAYHSTLYPDEEVQAICKTSTASQAEYLQGCHLKVDRVETGEGGYKYVASVYDADDNLYAGGEEGITPEGSTFYWQVSSDPTNTLSWEDALVSNPTQSVVVPYDARRFYRVTWRHESNTLGIDQNGPYNVVFVYDRAMTNRGRNAGYTTFTGYDASMQDELGNPKLKPGSTTEYYDPQYPDGSDANTGYDPHHAVKSMERAYELLDDSRGMAGNIIVVMGYYEDENFLRYVAPASKLATYSHPATITGTRGALISDGSIGMSDISSSIPLELSAATTFQYITFVGKRLDFNSAPRQLHLYCNLNDLLIGEGLKVKGYQDFTGSYGLLSSNYPTFTIVGGMHNFNGTQDFSYPIWNEKPDRTTITLNSGCFARVLGGGRNTGTNANSRNIFGSPTNPHRVEINVAITHATDEGTLEYADKPYAHDIGLLAGGQTDGSIYTECTINLRSGSIGRFISGNISFGRDATRLSNQTTPTAHVPSDSFFGSTTFNMTGGKIEELYGGTLGRMGTTGDDSSPEGCSAYFYGRSIIKIDGGEIYSDIYAAGAGGVSGVGDAVNHTNDPYIPYYNSAHELLYGTYEEATAPGCSFPTIHTLADDVDLQFDKTYCEVILASGLVDGNVFGGGFGYSKEIGTEGKSYKDGYLYASPQAGTLFGNSYVRMIGGRPNPAVVKGNVYGGGEGSPIFEEQAAANGQGGKFTQLARLYGNTYVNLFKGTVNGKVFGGARGVGQYPGMGDVFGKTELVLGDSITVMGNIFGGSEVADINPRADDPTCEETGNTHILIEGGVIGNNIFGGSQGTEEVATHIAGSAYMTITGGHFLPDPYVPAAIEGEDPTLRTFNVYGGGAINCIIGKDTHLDLRTGLLTSTHSIIDRDFLAAWNDISYRRFCVYGAGYGKKTLVRGDTYVDINVPEENSNKMFSTNTVPSDAPVTQIIPDQMFFDIAGGGYNGSVGYFPDEDFAKIPSNPSGNDPYIATYRGGNVHVTISGYTWARKVIGGGFYGNVKTANTKIYSGVFNSIYGGALLGYVFNRADLMIGKKNLDSVEPSNAKLFVLDCVYGGNDVKGIVGVRRYINGEGDFGVEASDGGPMYCADIQPSPDLGVVVNIFGGTIKGNVYGAGNGHYRGYYVPGWILYNDGAERDYRYVASTFPMTIGPRAGQYVGRTYRSRPMVGSVHLNISGNSMADRVVIEGDVFGGGRSCSIGQWDTALPYDDPRRLVKGGFLHINMGAHVTARDLYMGAEGELYSKQTTLPETNLPIGWNVDNVEAAFRDPETLSEQLVKLGNAAYDHWYWDGTTYRLGFPKPWEHDGNTGLYGEHTFRGYLKNIEMNGDIELTFYKDLYETGEHGSWVPGEVGLETYNAEDLVIDNFYLGGLSGSMTNNVEMKYKYSEDKEEKFGSIFRVTLPPGLTVRNKVVCGSKDACVLHYPYASDYRSVNSSADPIYRFDGGLVTRSAFTYALVYYNYSEMHSSPEDNSIPHEWLETHAASLPSSFYNERLKKTIYRGDYLHYAHSGDTSGSGYGSCTNQADDDEWYTALHLNGDGTVTSKRVPRDPYGLSIQLDSEGRRVAYIGVREIRGGVTAVKLTAACEFDPQEAPLLFTDNDGNDVTAERPQETTPYGGLIYGGCYNSGTTLGDVIMNIGCNMMGSKFDLSKLETYSNRSLLKYNIGRVFGGGYGVNSSVQGDVYVNLLHNFKANNVFGGGMLGEVNGTAHITYIGTENDSYVFGAIYGGGFRGAVGKRTVSTDDLGHEVVTYGDVATMVKLYSGNVDKVYGGGCLGDLYGSAHVELCDEVTTELDHLDYERLTSLSFIDEWGSSRLIAGTVYGGNDIAGNIYRNATDTEGFDTYVVLDEVQDPDSPTIQNAPNKIEVKDTPGTHNGYCGFPLVGNLYGGSNGDYGKISTTDPDKYATGSTWTFASGEGNTAFELDLGQPRGQEAYSVPNLRASSISIQGGTVVNAYGGGNMSTITEKASIEVVYDAENMEARAGFNSQEELTRMWNICHISSDQQIAEVLTESEVENAQGETERHYIFDYQVFRLFGGNNKADMDIQPTWNLDYGYVGSLYSGGNFGRMTHFTPADPARSLPATGITLTLDSPTFHANTVYGGGRVGNIEPTLPPGFTPDADFYGASLNILGGVIDHVFGGNDVSGNVQSGTHLNIRGAISGDVYGAGNGNYRYVYNPELPQGTRIQEEYDGTNGYRYFILPRLDAYMTPDGQGGFKEPKPAQRLLAINAYRPNAERVLMEIAGTPAADPSDPESHPEKVYVRGNVYCGGNSATISTEKTEDGLMKDIKLKIGSHVVLNGVFMGSNGESLVSHNMIRALEQMNNIDLSNENQLTDVSEVPARDQDAVLEKVTLYPHLLDLYMRAVEVDAMPEVVDLPDDVHDAYIGDFYLGGNSGSMMTDHPIEFSLPHALTIYGKVVGGSNSANLFYKGVNHEGGLTRPLQDKFAGRDKVHLSVHSQFAAKRLVYPLDGDIFRIRLEDDFVDAAGNPITDPDTWTGKKYYSRARCNVFGGCYNSGTTHGNITLDIYSDMLAGADKQVIIDGINDLQRRTFAVIGGGYGAATTVQGNTHVRVLPQRHVEGDTSDPVHPSMAAIFTGSQEGLILGNTTAEVRDGMVLANLYGASEAAEMYGSTQILIGYPRYYRCLTSRGYSLERADTYHDDVYQDAEGTLPVVRKKVWYREGDLVPDNVYRQILDADKSTCFTLEGYIPAGETEKRPYDPAYFGAQWDGIEIHIGDPQSRRARTPEDIQNAPYYAHGNIYGGGFISTEATVSLAGRNTVCKFIDDADPAVRRVPLSFDPSTLTGDDRTADFGGNSMIAIGDNPENANPAYIYNKETQQYSGAPAGMQIKDHITIGTARYIPVSLKQGDEKMGLFYYDPSKPARERFQHQPMGTYDATNDASKTFYRIEADGGIYGDGRKVFCEGFRAADLSYYGYADFKPQFAKLVNTFQRIDLMSVNDCCIQLQGATDFATNTYDATIYSMTRVGELRLNSSLAQNESLEEGLEDNENLGNIIHDKPRERNFMAFYHDVRYLSAIVSNVSFDDLYHTTKGEPSSGINVPEGDTSPNVSFRQAKKDAIDTYYAQRAEAEAAGEKTTNAQEKAFKKRNLGTSANMIGINNGYTLRIQGEKAPDARGRKIFYGPAVGVTEVKLLTLAIGEGGGYIFALNQHDEADSAPAPSDAPASPSTLQPYATYTEGTTTPHFLQTLGNFVFPGAKFLQTADADGESYNYIIDDCYPVGKGYDEYMASGSGNVNKDEEIHYWYVNGQRFFFNATLTAYTRNSSQHPASFFLENDDNLIFLSGVNEHTRNLRIESVQWGNHMVDDPETYASDQCDLTRTDKDGELTVNYDGYSLFLTLDEDTEVASSLLLQDHEEGTTWINAEDKNGAWISEVRREAYDHHTPLDATSGLAVGSLATDEVYLGSTVNGTFGKKTPVGEGPAYANSPTVGIMLRDAVDNNTKKYYDDHLAEPDLVKIKIVGENTDDGEHWYPYEYTINLTITYLKGPSVDGNIVIENCALPGEMIYINSFDVKVEVDDDNMGVMQRKWYVYPEQFEGQEEKYIDVSSFAAENERRIALPAYYFMDGWKVIYKVESTLGMERERMEARPDDLDPDMLQTLSVHNYHRMYPWDYSTYKDVAMQHPDVMDLQLVKDARVYIENFVDMAYLDKYLGDHQTSVEADRALDPNAHRGRIGDIVLPEAYDDLVVVDPQYARDIHFILTSDISMANPGFLDFDNDPFSPFSRKDAADPFVRSDKFDLNHTFAGIFSGNGHLIDLQDCTQLIGRNEGRIYNTGFFSARKDTRVIGHNNGRLMACFYYNSNPAGPYENITGSTGDVEEAYEHRGLFVGSRGDFIHLADDEQRSDYLGCYQNVCTNRVDNYGLDTYNEDFYFNYGRVAYNLNVLYLQERYVQARKAEDPSFVPVDETQMKSTYGFKYLDKYYYDGAYRYASADPDMDVDGYSVGKPDALRTNEYPNYHDHFQKGQIPASVISICTGREAAAYGRASTHHNTLHPEDLTRLNLDKNGNPVLDEKGNTTYVPNFPRDYIFFGQDLAYDPIELSFPTAVTPENRVYRASGFYGTKEDRAFHFNQFAFARYPGLTAIDFTGRRTRQRQEFMTNPNYSTALEYGRTPTNYEAGMYEWPRYQYHADYTPVLVDGAPVLSEEKEHMQRVFYPPVLDLPMRSDNDEIVPFIGTSNPFEMKISSFFVDSNPTVDDHDAVTKNLLVYTIPGQTAFNHLHYTEAMNTRTTQPASSLMETALALPQAGIQYDDQDCLFAHHIYWHATGYDPLHAEVIGSDTYAAGAEDVNSPSYGLFHVVDKQPLNVPIEFNVDKRIWYYRKPAAYSQGNTAWEGICLPFTANRVMATDFGETPDPIRSHGEISHFYGPEWDGTTPPDYDPEDYTHRNDVLHEYWLRGLTDVNADGTLAFERPDYAKVTLSTDGSRAEKVVRMYDAAGQEVLLDRADYLYKNRWFVNTYDLAGTPYLHNAYPEEGRTFYAYPFLTEGVPYIVSFPGQRYKEFSMDGNFYNSKKGLDISPAVQMITYEYLADAPNITPIAGAHRINSALSGSYTIKVTDEDGLNFTTAAKGFVHTGTFNRVALDDDQYTIVEKVDDVSGEVTGTSFQHAPYALPFRTYLTAPAGSRLESYAIGTGNAAAELDEETQDPYQDDSLGDDLTGLRMFVRYNQLVVHTPRPLMLTVYTPAGVVVARYALEEGENICTGLSGGLYVASPAGYPRRAAKFLLR